MKQTRRDFFRHSMMVTSVMTVATPIGLVGHTAEMALTSEKRKPFFELGLASYSLREFNQADCIAMSKRVGLKKICFKSMHLELNATDKQCKEAATACASAGLELYSVGVCYMNSEAEVLNTFRYAQAIGTVKVIVGVPKPELLPLVDEKVKETGIPVAIHNHGPGDKTYPTPDSIMQQIEKFDKRIGVCMDIGHTVRAGVDLIESVKLCSDRLYDVHVKDVTEATAKGTTAICGRGVIDIPQFLIAMNKANYQGVLAFEYEADAKDPMPGLAESVGFVRGAIAGIWQ